MEGCIPKRFVEQWTESGHSFRGGPGTQQMKDYRAGLMPTQRRERLGQVSQNSTFSRSIYFLGFSNL